LIDAGAITDAATPANELAAITDETIYNFRTVDTDPPVFNAAASMPADDALNHMETAKIILKFDERIRVVDDSKIKLYETTGDTLVTTSVSASEDEITMEPSGPLTVGNNYHVIIEAGAVSDTASPPNFLVAFADNTVYNFTVVADTTKPRLDTASSVPAAGATNVAISTNIALKFSEEVSIKTSNGVQLYETDTPAILVPAAISASGDTVTINPNNDLKPGTVYYVTIAAGAIEDKAATPNGIAAITSTSAYSFTTAADTTKPTLDASSSIPAAGATKWRR